jgi:F-type H+-transporting ATPase subunit a
MAAIAPEVLTQIGPLPITNTLINTLIIDSLLVGGAIYLSKNIKKVPGMFQNIAEMIIDVFYKFTESIAGKNVKQIFPWVFTFFIFILLSNWSGLLPGFASIGWFEKPHAPVATEVHEEVAPIAPVDDHGAPVALDDHGEPVAPAQTDDSHAAPSEEGENKLPATESHEKGEAAGGHAEETHLVPLFRNATSDANVTFALAIVSVVATHVLSVRKLGWKEYLGRYFSLNPIFLFVGILEIVSELTKMVSLSFRLFGNIYAGEVVLGTVHSLFAFLFPLPFMALEIIVGLVQALVFAILTMVFMSIMMTPHHAEEEAKH